MIFLTLDKVIKKVESGRWASLLEIKRHIDNDIVIRESLRVRNTNISKVYFNDYYRMAKLYGEAKCEDIPKRIKCNFELFSIYVRYRTEIDINPDNYYDLTITDNLLYRILSFNCLNHKSIPDKYINVDFILNGLKNDKIAVSTLYIYFKHYVETDIDILIFLIRSGTDYTHASLIYAQKMVKDIDDNSVIEPKYEIPYSTVDIILEKLKFMKNRRFNKAKSARK